MGAESPNVILYDVNGQEMSVSNGSSIPAGTSPLFAPFARWVELESDME